MKSAFEWMEQLDRESHTTEPGVTEIREEQIHAIQADALIHAANLCKDFPYTGDYAVELRRAATLLQRSATPLSSYPNDTTTRAPQ